MEDLKWRYYEFKRLYRLYVSPEDSVKRLMQAVGVFWLWRRGAKREYKVRLWKDSKGWYALDLALPHKQLGVEADGWVHNSRRQQDIARDQRLADKGWRIMRVNDEEVKANPRGVRRRVRRFLRG